MSKKRSRLFLSITALMFCIGIMCFGVYAATSVSYTLSGHISYEVNDVFVDIETRHYLSKASTLSEAQSESAQMMSVIATRLESGTTSIDGVTELASDYDEQSTLNNVGGENLPLTGPALNITYGAYSNVSGQEKAYVHYIAILVTNYAEEEINAILNLDSLYDLEGSNSIIYAYRTMENIPAKSGETKGVMSYVFALGLDQPSQSADVDFSGVSLSVTRGNLDQYASSGLVFEYSETDGGYLVSDYTGTDTRVIVPSTYAKGENLPKNVVGTKNSSYSAGAFDSTAIREIYLPKTFKTIGGYSFSGCSSLTSITIPDSVESIGSNAFYGCKFKSVTYSTTGNSTYDFVNGTLTIRGVVSDNPAWNSDNINPLIISIVFNDSNITSIGDRAFSSCSSLTSITIPSSVESIGDNAFYGCTSLSEITIPSSVTSIGGSAFYNTPWLETLQSESNGIATASDGDTKFAIAIPTTITEIKLTDVKVIASNAFSYCTSLSEITIPSSVISIGDRAFNRCTSLSEITIPESVESIGDYAFDGCTKLTSVYFEDEINTWTVRQIYGYEILTISISDPSTMATYLKSTYNDYTWTKNGVQV